MSQIAIKKVATRNAMAGQTLTPSTDLHGLAVGGRGEPLCEWFPI